MSVNAGWTPLILAGALALCAGARGVTQPLVFEWDAGLGTTGSLYDRGDGPLLDSRDSLSADVSVSHELGAGEMTYRAGGELFYQPQQLQPEDPWRNEFLPFPSALSAEWELRQPRLQDPWMRVGIGRLEAREPTGLLLEDPLALHPAQPMDGVVAEARYRGFYFSLSAGYLGLLDKRINRVRFTEPDSLELTESARYFAPPRGLGIFRAEAENLLVGQSVGLFGIWQKDFRADEPQFDSWYVGTVVDGRIVTWLRQSSCVVVGVGAPSEGSSSAGLLLSTTVALDLPGELAHEAWFSVLWASGRGGGLSAFPALAGPSISSTLDVPLQDIVKLELGADARLPVVPTGAVLDPALAVRLLLVPSGAVPAGYSYSFSGPYAGTEIEMSVVYVPVAGLTVTARGAGLITVHGVFPSLRLGTGVRL